MAINYPGPYELRITYTETAMPAPTLQHIARYNIALVETAAQGDTFANYDVEDKDGATTIALSTIVENFLTIFNAGFAVGMDIDTVELWKYPTAMSFDSVYWSAYTPTANVGTNGGGGQASAQNIYSFRTAEGGIMKLSPMEGVIVPGKPQSYAALPTYASDMVDWILDGDGATYSAVFLGRDTSYPFAFNQMFPGQNEDLWKKRNGRK